jgi:hypothetical protein
MVEQVAFNHKAIGSNPIKGTYKQVYTERNKPMITKGEFFLAVAKSGIHPRNIISNLWGNNIFSFQVSSYEKAKLKTLKKNSGFNCEIISEGINHSITISCDCKDNLTTEDCLKIDSAIRANKST